MNHRHAYMIMAHNKFDILKKLLEDIDDVRNDIFLHIDAKSPNYNLEDIKKTVHYSKLYLIEQISIYWGGYSQIECILMLLKSATQLGYHSYYHFMVGVEFPLKTQNYIHDFFDKNTGYEFIGFDSYDKKYIERIRYYHPFNSYARNNNFFQKILNKIRIFIVYVQKFFNVDLVKKYNIEFKKGNASWSITHDLAVYIISYENLIKKIYKHSFCGDEIFIHTIVYNSVFWDKVYDKNDEYKSSMRLVTWEDPVNQFHMKDLEFLLSSKRLFARKIDGEDALELIETIKKRR